MVRVVKEMATHSSILAWRIAGRVGCSPRGRRESDTTELLHFTSLHGEGGTEGREPQGKQMLQRLSCPERKLWACPVAISGSPQPGAWGWDVGGAGIEGSVPLRTSHFFTRDLPLSQVLFPH